MGPKLRFSVSLTIANTAKLRHWNKESCVQYSTVNKDYMSTNPKYVSVTKGQRVEVMEVMMIADVPWCLVRVIDDQDTKQEGLLPSSFLQTPPSLDKFADKQSQSDLLEEFRRRSNSATIVRQPNRKTLASTGGIKKFIKRKLGPSTTSFPTITQLNTSAETQEQTSTAVGYIESSEDSAYLPNCGESSDEDMELPPPPQNCNVIPSAETDQLSEKLATELQLVGETICNHSCQENSPEQELYSNESLEEAQSSARQKRFHVIMELLETEKGYVNDLGCIVEGYLEELKQMELPEDLIGKDKIVFGNIHQIYDFHRETFLPEVEKCGSDAQALGSLFKRYERRLYMYVKYCENKPKSEFIVAEYIDTVFNEIRRKLNHRLLLTDLLIKPVQRIMKYQLLLKDILKYTIRSGENSQSLEAAVQVMHVVPKAANDMMNVGRLQGFHGILTAQGKLLLQDTLRVAEHNPSKELKYKERRIFLFEQTIIFSEVIESKNSLSQPHYVYKQSIKVNKLAIDDAIEDDPLSFKLTDKSLGREDYAVRIQTTTPEIKCQWVSQIKAMLDMQGNFLRALQSPIEFQREQLVPGLSQANIAEGCAKIFQHHERSASAPVINDLPKTKTKKPSSLFDSLRGRKNSSKLRTNNDGKPSKLPKARMFSKFTAEKEDEISGSRGDIVQIMDVDRQYNRLLVFKPASGNNPDVEGWLPGHILGIGQAQISPPDVSAARYLSAGEDLVEKLAQRTKLKMVRKRSVSPNGKKMPKRKLSFRINALSNSMYEPQFDSMQQDVAVNVNEKASFTCEVHGKPRPNVFWFNPNGEMALPTAESDWHYKDKKFTFTIDPANKNHSGIYTCLATSEMGFKEKSITLTVRDVPGTPGKPTITVQNSDEVHLSWSKPDDDGNAPVQGYSVEKCYIDSIEWTDEIEFVSECHHVIQRLEHNKFYVFRVRAYNCVGVSETSLLSDPVLIEDPSLKDKISELETFVWRKHFEELFEIISTSRQFRYGTVRECRKKGTEDTILAKFVDKAKKSRALVEEEISILTQCQHLNIAYPDQCYDTIANHVMIFEGIGENLLNFICRTETIAESEIQSFTAQLLLTVQCLQQCNILHLNIQPENIKVTFDSQPILKLMGFEHAIKLSNDTVVPTSEMLERSHEFKACEFITGGPLSLATDIWSVGVIVYLMVTGVSPFYDDDDTVMCENIRNVKVEYPADLFCNVQSQCLTLLKVTFMQDFRMRPSAQRCLQCSWLKTKYKPQSGGMISTNKLKEYVTKRQTLLHNIASPVAEDKPSFSYAQEVQITE